MVMSLHKPMAKINHLQRELSKKKKQFMSKHEEAMAVENELNGRRRDVESVITAMESVPYKDGQLEALRKDRQVELDVVQKLRDEDRILSGQLANVRFQYRDPINNFDRSKVKGVATKLIKVAARGKLYNVVVDTELTGKQVL